MHAPCNESLEHRLTCFDFKPSLQWINIDHMVDIIYYVTPAASASDQQVSSKPRNIDQSMRKEPFEARLFHLNFKNKKKKKKELK